MISAIKRAADHSMSLHARTEGALQACYDAILMPELWSTALQQLADALAVSSCTFTPLDGKRTSIDGNGYSVPVSAGHLEFAKLWCVNQSHARCPFTGKALPFVSNYVIDDQIVTADDRKTLAYFHETAGPRNREWWAAGSFAIADRQWCLSVYRNRAGGRFNHSEGRYLARVAPGFGRTAALAEKFGMERISSALTTFDQLKCPAMMIDWRGSVRNPNRLADAGKGLALASRSPLDDRSQEQSTNRGVGCGDSGDGARQRSIPERGGDQSRRRPVAAGGSNAGNRSRQ